MEVKEVHMVFKGTTQEVVAMVDLVTVMSVEV